MSVPADQNFTTISGTLGTGFATIDGITYFNTDPAAILSVSGSTLSLGASALSQTVAGFKTADGSEFELNGLDLYSTGTFELNGYRDGIFVAGASLAIAVPARVLFGDFFPNIDELRITGPDSAPFVIDTLDFSAPVVTHQPPAIADLSGDVSNYVEGGLPVFIDDGRNADITDPDTFFFNGGSLLVEVTANHVASEDVLGILTGSGVSLSGALANGVTVFVGATAIGTVTSDGSQGTLAVSFNASATAAAATALLHAITYQNSNAANPDTSPRTIQTVFGDGDGQSSVVYSTVTVGGVNDAPVAVASAGGTSYIEGTPVVVDAGLSVSDIDSANLAGATIQISGNRAAADQLLFNDQNGITGLYDAASGTLTLTGTQSLAIYQAALRSIEFSTDQDPGALTRTVTYTVNDGTLTSAPVTRAIAVTPINDAPSAAHQHAPVAFTENGAAVAIESGLLLADPDNTTLSFATVTFTAGFHAGQDVLGFTAAGGIAGSYDAAIGRLDLTGVASIADYQAVLRSVTYANSAEDPDTTTRALSFSVSDGSVTALIAANLVNVTAVNDAPVLSSVAAAASYAQHGAAVTLSAGLSVSDVDSASLAGATVHVVGGTFAGDGDILSASVAGTAITASYDAATETLTLSGADTRAHYAQVLDTVTFESTAADATDGGVHATRTIAWQVDDGAAANNLSAVASTTVTIKPPSSATFNSGGQGGILWQNADGTPAVWLTNGTSLSAGANIGFNPGPSWHVIGPGDFNGDGKADVLWQNVDGTPAVWLMDGTHLIAGGNVGFNPGAAWHVIASGDFDGDGKADILWQNNSGQAAVWLMDGLNVKSGSDVGFNPGAAWHAIGAGDFNGDGKSDILWQNHNGQAAVWLMNGLNVMSGADVGFNPGAAWHVQGAGDFNGDAKADILWQNQNGEVAVWQMDGTHLVAGANVGFNPGAAWQVHGATDLDGDGRADILLQNLDGTPAAWLMDGFNVVTASAVGFNPGAAWHVVPQHHDVLV